LSETGYVEGKNVAIEYRYAEAHYDRVPALAAELVERKVDVIFSNGPGIATRAAKNATSTIPIVFHVGVDPVAFGLVDALARPGGNLTGFTIFGAYIQPKRLELLCELLPQARTIADLVNPANPASPATPESIQPQVQEVARAKGVQLHLVKASNESEIEAAFATLPEIKADAILIGPDVLFYKQQDQLAALASRYAVPLMHNARSFVQAGGLISYGAREIDSMRGAGRYVGRILNGEKPTDLPVQQPSEFDLVINMKTANALGLTVPQSMLIRAELIE
jgi:putative ABC transport system substrate-binding protein